MQGGKAWVQGKLDAKTLARKGSTLVKKLVGKKASPKNLMESVIWNKLSHRAKDCHFKGYKEEPSI